MAWLLSKLFGNSIFFITNDSPATRNQADSVIRSNIGGIICSVMMQQLNQKHPDNYLLAMRIIWAPVGLMIICWMFIPESPWFHARRGNKDKALRCMRQLYSGVKGYDIEEEYGIIVRTIEHERSMLQDEPKYIDIFKGLNLVCSSFSDPGKELRVNKILETNTDCDATCCLTAARRSCHHQYLLNL